MRRVLLGFVTCILLGAPAVAWPTADSPDSLDDHTEPNAWDVKERARATLHQIVLSAQRSDRDYHALSEHLRALFADVGFSGLTPAEQHEAYLMYAGALYNTQQYATARGPIQQASEMPDATALDWELRLENALQLADYADAARAATDIAQRWPDQLKRYDDRVFATIVAETRRQPDTAPLASGLLAALTAAHRPLQSIDFPRGNLRTYPAPI